jgi:hypothetical protein
MALLRVGQGNISNVKTVGEGGSATQSIGDLATGSISAAKAVDAATELPMKTAGNALPGPAFISKLDQGGSWGGGAGQLAAVVNKEHISVEWRSWWSGNSPERTKGTVVR